MLSPNEIANAKFDRAMGRGYKVDDIENFLSKVAGDFSTVLQEKQDVEGKLVMLADKLEEYRRDEESMRSALIGAQKLGDSVIRDAKAKASAIIDDAGGRAQLLLDNARKTIEKEQIAYARMQREVAAFKSKLQHLYKQHLEMITTLPSDDGVLETDVTRILPQEDSVTMPQQNFAPQYTESPQQQYAPTQPQYEMTEESEYDLPEPGYAEEDSEMAEEYNLSEDNLPPVYDEEFEEEYMDEKPRDSKFGTLKFGQEYSISRTDKRKK